MQWWGRKAHNRIAINVTLALNAHLRGGPYQVYMAGVKVSVEVEAHRRTAGAWKAEAYADEGAVRLDSIRLQLALAEIFT